MHYERRNQRNEEMKKLHFSDPIMKLVIVVITYNSI